AGPVLDLVLERGHILGALVVQAAEAVRLPRVRIVLRLMGPEVIADHGALAVPIQPDDVADRPGLPGGGLEVVDRAVMGGGAGDPAVLRIGHLVESGYLATSVHLGQGPGEGLVDD